MERRVVWAAGSGQGYFIVYFSQMFQIISEFLYINELGHCRARITAPRPKSVE